MRSLDGFFGKITTRRKTPSPSDSVVTSGCSASVTWTMRRSCGLIGSTGTLLLPASPTTPGKVRVEIKGRAEDFVANVVEDGGNLPTGTTVLIVAEGERGSLLVAKHEM